MKKRLFAALMLLVMVTSPICAVAKEIFVYADLSGLEGMDALRQSLAEEDEEGEEAAQEGEEEEPQPFVQYVVTFDVNGVLSTQMIDADTLLPQPDDPEGKGNFLGWYKNDQSLPYDFLLPVTGDMTLTARFSSAYMVRFLDQAGYVIHAQEVAEGKKIEALDWNQLNLAANQSFLHWYDADGDNQTAFAFDQGIDRNLRLAPYITNHRVVVFVSSGSQVDPMVIQENVVPMPDDPQKPGYTFLYWSLEEGGAEYPLPGTYEQDGNLTLYAVWQAAPVDYTIEYWIERPNTPGDPDPAEDIEDYMYHSTKPVTKGAMAGEGIRLPEDVALNAISTNTADATRSYFTLHFKYLEPKEPVVVAGDGSTVIRAYFNRVVHEIGMNFNPTPTATNISEYTIGYDVDTWYDALGDDQIHYMYLKLDQLVYPQWPTQKRLIDEALAFSTWSGYFSYNPRKESIFDANMYDVIVQYTNKTMMLEAKYKTEVNYVYRIYYMELLDQDAHDDSMINMPGMPGTSMKIKQYDQYQGKWYQLEPGLMTQYQQGVVVPAGTKKGCKGWPGAAVPGFIQPNTGMDGDHQGAPYLLLDKSGQQMYSESGQTCYVLPYYCDRATYTLTYNSLGGNVLVDGAGKGNTYESKVKLVMGGAMPQEVGQVVAQKEHATFLGWYYDQGFDHQAKPGDITGTANVILYAKYAGSGVTVRFYDRVGGKALATAETAPGEKIEMPQGLYQLGQTYENVRFTGWVFYLKGMPVPFEANMPISSDLDLYSTWDPEGTYKVNYHKPEGGLLAEYEVKNAVGQNSLTGSLKYAPKDPVMSGMTFMGWYLNEQGSGPRFTAATHVTQDVDLYPAFAGPLTILNADDVYVDTNKLGATGQVLYYGNLTGSAVVLKANLRADGGHPYNTLSATVALGDKAGYPPMKNSRAALAEEDAKALTLTVTDSMNRQATTTVKLYVMDTGKPAFAGEDRAKYRVGQLPGAGDIWDQMGLSVSDDYADEAFLMKNLTNDLDKAIPQAKRNTPGSYTLTYQTQDTVGNVGAAQVRVTLWDEKVTAQDITVPLNQVAALQAADYVRLMKAKGTYLDGSTADSPIVTVDFSQVVAAVSDAGYPVTFTAKEGATCQALVRVVDDQYQVKTSSDQYGTITPTAMYDYGADVVIAYSPLPGYRLASLTVDGAAETNLGRYATQYRFPAIDKDHQVAVRFEPMPFTITASVENGTMNHTGAIVRNYGDSLTISYAPKEGYELDGVTVDGQGVDGGQYGSSYTFAAIDRNHAIHVKYKPTKFSLTVRHYLEGTTTELAPATVGQYAMGDKYQVSALTIDHYQAKTASLAGEMPAGDLELAIYYQAAKYKVVASAVNGTISPSGTTLAPYMGSVSVSYAPKKGYVLEGVTVDGRAVDKAAFQSGYTFAAIDQDHRIVVSYRAVEHKLTVHHYLAGTTTPVRKDTVRQLAAGAPYVVYADRALDALRPLVGSVSGTMPEGDWTDTIYYEPVTAPDQPAGPSQPVPTPPAWQDEIEYLPDDDGQVIPVIPPKMVDDARDRITQPLFTIYNEDIPLAGATSRSMGDKEE